MSNKARIFVLGSIFLNVLLVGVVTGHFLKVIGRDGRMLDVDNRNFGITAEQVTDIRDHLHVVHTANQGLFVKVDQRREQALRILVDESFDAMAYQRQIDAIHKLRGEAMQTVADAVKNMATGLDANERAALAEFLRNPPPAVNETR